MLNVNPKTVIKIAGLACNVAGMILGAISQKTEIKETIVEEVAKHVKK